ncbi:hypothetical protein [Arcticibacter sp.]|uniref:hypothetical protein n=1 Tax=Arcticibacter sp. TaxID=1872630 RepID=UPI00388CFC5B
MRFWSSFILSVILACALAAGGCRQHIKTKSGVREYISNRSNRLVGEKEFPDGTIVKLHYLPSALLGIDNKSSDRYYFLLSFSREGRELLSQLDGDSYSEMVTTLSFKMLSLIYVIPDRGKAISIDDCLFQQTFGMTGANELLVVFNPSSLRNVSRFQMKIKEFGLMLGDMNFEFDQRDINELNDILDNNLIISDQ